MKQIATIALLLSLYSSAARGAVSEPRCTTSGYTNICYNIQSDSFSYLYSYFENWQPGFETTPTHSSPTPGPTESYSTDSTVTERSPGTTERLPTMTEIPTTHQSEPSMSTISADTSTLEFRDSILNDLPSNTFYYMFYNVDRLVFTNCSFKVFPFVALEGFEYVYEVQIQKSYIASWSGLYNTDFYDFLTTITLSNNVLSDLPVEAFYNLPSVRTINLSGNQIGTVQDRAFYELNDVQTIDLSHNRIQSIVSTAFVTLPRLTTLHLHDNNLMSLGNGTFLSSSMPELTTLTVQGNPFICDCSLEWLKNFLDQEGGDLNSTTCACPDSKSFSEVDFCGWDAIPPAGLVAGCGRTAGCRAGDVAVVAIDKNV